MPKTSPLAARLKPAYALELDGEKYELVFDYNAVAEAEAETGGMVNLLHGILYLNSMSALQLRGLFYAALKPKQPKITLAEAGSLINLETMPLIMAGLAEAWKLSMPEAAKNPTDAGSAPGE